SVEVTYRSLVFEGVCSNLSNSAYPVAVERIRRLIADEDNIAPRHRNLCIHVALTLVHRDILEWDSEGEVYVVADTLDADERTSFIRQICESLEIRSVEGETDKNPLDFAAFIRLLESTLDALTDGEWEIEVEN
ncbi:MAG: hypothetical protein SXQ77_10235, partial [Halobacteria archaeon]|nr:hypothetical protein [Halobacteria archaeon]